MGEIVRQIDSSLLDEWQALTAESIALGVSADAAHGGRPRSEPLPPARSVVANERAFTIMVRNAAFRLVRAAALERVGELVDLDPHGLSAEEWAEALSGYFTEYDRIGTGAEARSAALLSIDRSRAADGAWSFRQTLDDPSGDRDWAIEGEVDLSASEDAGDAILSVRAMAPFRY